MQFVAARFDINLHRSELEDQEPSSPVANSFLPEQDWPRGNDLNPDCDEDREGQPNGQTEHNTSDVHHAFPSWNLTGVASGRLSFIGAFRLAVERGQGQIASHRSLLEMRAYLLRVDLGSGIATKKDLIRRE
jgi:hypothetical protein